MAIENLSQDLADLLATKNFEVKYTDEKGQDSAPSEAKVFAFDWVASSGKNYGTVVIVLGDDNDLQLFFGDNLGKTMDDPEDKLDWFGSERHPGFLEEISRFATTHGMGTFSPKNINQLKHTMQGMAAIKEGLFEGYYGTRRVSYVGEQTEARLVIKHNRMIGEDDKRYRYVESLFIETQEGERFKLPFVKLSGGRAMLEHVRQGGRPYDIRGQHIAEIVTEMAVLSRFNRASQQRVFEGVTQQLVETAQHYYQELRDNLQHMATGRGYQQYFESWTPADIGEESALVEDLKTMFIEQTLDARIEAALPTLAKLQQRGNAMKEAEIFENWVNQVMEGSWALPDTPEAQAKLNELMSKELIVGPDATNAKEQLYDVIGDDQLFDILTDLAEQDPRANVWDDTDVQARLQELGIQMNTTADAEQQQPVAPAAGQQAPGTAPEQGVAEGAELAAMLKHAGVPVAESRIHENSEYTYEKVAKILAREKPGMTTNRNSDEFYSAVYHELIAIGMTPKAARNLISYDEDFMSDVASAYAHYQSNPGLDESNSGMIMPEADPIATFEVMPNLSTPVQEGTCNMTAEGEYCPEHGLAECGYMESMGGTVAGAMAPVIGEAPQDPINYNGAITGSYYESDELARMKALALGEAVMVNPSTTIMNPDSEKMVNPTWEKGDVHDMQQAVVDKMKYGGGSIPPAPQKSGLAAKSGDVIDVDAKEVAEDDIPDEFISNKTTGPSYNDVTRYAEYTKDMKQNFGADWKPTPTVAKPYDTAKLGTPQTTQAPVSVHESDTLLARIKSLALLK